jgi:serine/threonine protein kinase
VYLVMDYEDGGNLLDQIRSENFPTMKEKIKFLVDMLNAFEFLRIKGIIHRDIKPENILYSKRDDSYKISDFGLAI